MLKKVLSILLAVVMVLPLLSSTAMGASTTSEIEFKYDAVDNYGTGAVWQNDKWGLVDTRTGREILSCEYEFSPSDGGEGFVIITQRIDDKELIGFLDKTGKTITPCKYVEAYKFSDGLAAVKGESGKWGFIDGTGEEVISLQYDYAGDFVGGMAVVHVGEAWSDEGAECACIDKSGNEVVPFGKYYYISSPSGEGLRSVMIKEGEKLKHGVIDNTGNEIIPCQYDAASYFGNDNIWDDDGLAVFEMDREYAVFNKEGRMIVPFGKYDMKQGWRTGYGGLKAVEYNGKWGFIDSRTGEEVIACKYDDCENLEDGYAAVCLDGKWGMADKTGKEVIACIYDDFFGFGSGDTYTTAYLNGEKKIIDRTGKEVTKYDDVKEGSGGIQGVHTGGGWGAVDSTGNEILPCKYGSISGSYGYVIVTVYDEDGYGKSGLFDGEGNEILPAEYSHIDMVSKTLAAVNVGGWYHGKWGFLYLGGDNTAYTSTQTVLVDGKAVTFQCYALRDASGNDTNYIKLRDMATILNGTAAQFNVNYDGSIVIETKKPYTTANGTEMNTPFGGDRDYKENTDVTKIDGVASDLAAITLTDDNGGGYTYYKLRDLGKALGFNVGWDNTKGNIFVETDKAYDPNN